MASGQKQLMAAFLTSPVRKDKKDALIASELKQQALCTNPSGKTQIHKNITIASFFISVTTQILAH